MRGQLQDVIKQKLAVFAETLHDERELEALIEVPLLVPDEDLPAVDEEQVAAQVESAFFEGDYGTVAVVPGELTELLKLTNGVESQTMTWNFTLTGLGVNESDSSPPTTVDFGGAKLIPGEEYTLCETGIPAGWSLMWVVDVDVSGTIDIPPDILLPFVGGEADEVLIWPLGGLAYVSPPHEPSAHLATAIAGVTPVDAAATTARCCRSRSSTAAARRESPCGKDCTWARPRGRW